jgi:polyadenylate-binding protein
MPSRAVKQFSTVAADTRPKKIQPPPPPNDGAAPPNNLSLPYNDGNIYSFSMSTASLLAIII